MQVLRTPDERFTALPDFPFLPHYVEVDDGEGGRLRMHYLDEGDERGEVVLLLHGEPSWSFLYRHMIPDLAATGLRVLAVDLVGFGRSDKPTRRDDYSYQAHVDWTWSAVTAIGLDSITLVCQDWGGLIGLRLVGEHPDRFTRVVAANTFLPTGDRHPGEAFLAWQRYSQEAPDFRAGRIVDGGCVSELSPAVIAGYDAPFPDDTYQQGARQFPMLVPTDPADPAAAPNRAAWDALGRYDGPFLCAFSDSDPITAGADRVLRDHIPGARHQQPVTISRAGHFLQEDRGHDLASAIANFIAASPIAAATRDR